MKKVKISLLLMMVCISGLIKAQAPNWTVDFRAYQYNMSVTTVITNDCIELTDSNNIVGAFVNDTLRGVGHTLEDSGRYYALFLVYSNLSFGDTISFRYYDAATDSVYFALFGAIFQDNGTVGDFTNPFPVINNIPPDSILLSSNSIMENESMRAVGALSSFDISFIPQTHTYALINGPGDDDNAHFSIQGDTLYLDSAFDYEKQSMASVRIQSADNNGCARDEVFQITIGNVNEAPVDLLLSANTVDENGSGMDYVGQLTAIDQDSNETFTYSLVASASSTTYDNQDFTLQNDSLFATTAFNFEMKDSLSILIEVFDAMGNRLEKAMTVMVMDLNDLPDSISLSQSMLNENLPSGTLVGDFSTLDEDAGQMHQYTFNNITGNNNTFFSIVGNQLFTNSTFNYEQQSQYLIYVQSSDQNGGTVTEAFTIMVADTNDAPTDIFLSNASVNELQTVGTFVGLLSTTDEDSLDRFTYGFTTGIGSSDNANFSISSDSLFTAIVLDSSLQSQHNIRVITTDSTGAFYSEAFNIFVKRVNKLPTAINLSTDSIDENAAIGSIAAFLSTIDLDPGDVHSYTLVSGAGDEDNAAFSIFNNQLLVDTTFDFNVKTSYRIRLQSDDGFGGTFQDTFQLHIRNTNDQPIDLLLSDTVVAENLDAGTIIGLLSTVDPDLNDIHTYELAFGNNDNQLFNLSGDTLYTAVSFNFEVANQFNIDLRSIDAGGLFYTKRYTINISDTNDSPTDISLSTDTLKELATIGTTLLNLSSTDEDVNDSFSYTLVSGIGDIDNAVFRVANDDLILVSNLDFETQPTLSIRLRTEDAQGGAFEKSLKLTVTDEAEAPTDIILSSLNFDENLDSSSTIINLSTSDEDLNESFTYALVDGGGSANNALFAISGNDILTNAHFDFEDKDEFKIRIKTTDKDGLTFEKEILLQVNDQNDAPIGVNQQFTISENEAVGSVIAQLNFTDEDANEVLTYELLDNPTLFSVESTTGDLIVANNLNFENDKTITLSAKVKDASGASATSEVTIFIENAIDDKLPVAKIFSPNDDGMNDTWRIANVESYSDYRLIIFTASGEVVHEVAADYNNDWNGTFKGKNLPEGVYYYFFQNNTNSSKVFKGSITLKR